jgi:hypothetical protein
MTRASTIAVLVSARVSANDDPRGGVRQQRYADKPMTPEQQTLLRDSFAKVGPIAPDAAAA